MIVTDSYTLITARRVGEAPGGPLGKGGSVQDRIVWTIGTLAALAATGVAWVLRWLNARGLEVIDTDVPDSVPVSWVEMHAR